MKKRSLVSILVCLVILIGMNFLPESEVLSRAAISAIGVLAAVLILLLTEAIPIGVACLLAPALLIVFQAAKPGAAFSGFSNPIVFFVLASFGISAAIVKVNLSKRLLAGLLKVFGKSVNSVLFALMLCTALISSVISNVAAAAIFITVALDFLNIYENEKDRRRTGVSFMIALPIASMLGGMLTPAGSSLNLLCLNFLEKLTGKTVSFVQWMALGIPIVIVILPIAWKLIIWCNKPVQRSKEQIQLYVESMAVNKKLSSKEKYVLALLSAMLVCWVLGSWFPVFNITVVAIIGVSLFFLPGKEILGWKEFCKDVSWEAILLVGSIISLGNCLIETGASTFLVSMLLPSSVQMSAFAIALLVSLVIFGMLLVIPVAPALISIVAAPLVALATGSGIAPTLLIMVLAFTVCNCFLLPLDTVPLLTYMTGYYKKIELARTALPIQICIALVVAIWLPLMLPLLGL